MFNFWQYFTYLSVANCPTFCQLKRDYSDKRVGGFFIPKPFQNVTCHMQSQCSLAPSTARLNPVCGHLSDWLFYQDGFPV